MAAVVVCKHFVHERRLIDTYDFVSMTKVPANEVCVYSEQLCLKYLEKPMLEIIYQLLLI